MSGSASGPDAVQERIQNLEDALEQQQDELQELRRARDDGTLARLRDTIAQLDPSLSRREALQAAGLAAAYMAAGATGGAAVTAALTEEASAAPSGQLGTASDPWQTAYIDQLGTPSNPVSQAHVTSTVTDDLDIGSADFVASGEFVPRATFGNVNQRVLSTSSTDYQSNTSYSRHAVRWDRLVGDAQGAVALGIYIVEGSGESASVRVRNSSQGEVMLEQTSGIFGGGGPEFFGPVDYSPGSPSSQFFMQVEGHTDPGSASTSFGGFQVYVGVQL